MTHLKSCAKSKGVAPDRLVQLMRDSKRSSSAVVVSEASSGMEGSSSSSRMEGEGEGEGGGRGGEPLRARRSKRLVGKGGKEGKGVESATTVSPKEDEDFAMPPPVSRPAARRGRKRKRDNLQDKLVL
jgi:hypothetical protein